VLATKPFQAPLKAIEATWAGIWAGFSVRLAPTVGCVWKIYPVQWAEGMREEVRQIVREEMDASGREFFSYDQAADYLGVTVEALRMECKRRRLSPSRKRPTIFHRDELRRWARG
jgi:hypothetical protein